MAFLRKKTVAASLGAILLAGSGVIWAQAKKDQRPARRDVNLTLGKEMFAQYCASCHGIDGKGSGPAAAAMKTAPSDLTQLSADNEGKYPDGYIGALLKFGRNIASHGSEEMPVWGARFRELDPVRDPTGQQHIDDLVAYVKTLQAK